MLWPFYNTTAPRRYRLPQEKERYIAHKKGFCCLCISGHFSTIREVQGASQIVKAELMTYVHVESLLLCFLSTFLKRTRIKGSGKT